MKNKVINFLMIALVAICVYGPNIPSGGYAYAPEVPEEIKKMRENSNFR